MLVVIIGDGKRGNRLLTNHNRPFRPLFELANYYMLGRILYFVPYCSPIHPGRVLTTFAAISIVVEALNGNGSALVRSFFFLFSSGRRLLTACRQVANQSLEPWRQELGRTLLRAALILQLVVIGLFLTLATYFWHKCRQHGIRNAKLNQSLLTLYLSNGLILVRCIFRTVEFFDLETTDWSAPDLNPSPIIRYEAFFYVFEASLMLCNTVLLNIRHPRRYLPQSTYLPRPHAPSNTEFVQKRR